LVLLALLALAGTASANEETEHGGSETTEHEEETEAEESENKHKIDQAMALHMILLILTFLLGFMLTKAQFKYLGEAGVGLLLGAFAGAILTATNGAEYFSTLVQFDESVFFLVLLPPIIFEAGYNMKRRYFFRNLGTICTFAFLGTFASTFIVGFMMWAVGQMGLVVEMGLLECLVFGALISATDPVTVLAVFSKLKADNDLFSIVFGESVLNDAVAIVLYGALGNFRTEPFTAGACGWAVFEFFEIFIVSFVIGTGSALLLAWACQSVTCEGNEDMEHAELAAVLVTPYIAYLVAESIHMSGIVTILFCGIAMSIFVRPNVAPHVRDLSAHVVKCLAHVFETYVFVYLGLSLFTLHQVWDTAIVSVYAIVICLFARVCNIYPLSFILNKFIKQKIGPKKQFTMWFSGLRGAIAFVLALQASEDFKDQHGGEILTTTIVIIFFTVLVFGGYIWPVLEKLELRQPQEDKAHVDPFRMAIMLLEEMETRQDGDLQDDDFELKASEAIQFLEHHTKELDDDLKLLQDVRAGEADPEEQKQLLKRLRSHAHMAEDEEREEHWRHEAGTWIKCLCGGLLWCRECLSGAADNRDVLRQSMRSSASSVQMRVLTQEEHSKMDEDVEDNQLQMEDQ
jgi:sodium/hydrogen exchanger 3